MGTRQISDKMASGELSSIKVGGVGAEKEVVVLGSVSAVDNTSDADKPISTAALTANALQDADVADIVLARDAARTNSGFDRENTTTMGIIQYCHNAASGIVDQIDEEGAYTRLAGQTHFADGVTALVDRTIAQYHSAVETQFSYWYRGSLVVKTGIETLQLPDVSVTQYVTYEVDGALHVASDMHDATINDTLVALFYNNATTGAQVWFADERHGIVMSPQTHWNIHNQRGFGLGSGLDINGLANNVDVFTNIEAGICGDEDVKIAIAARSAAPFLFRSGADGAWEIDFTQDNNKLGYFVGADVVWNEDTGAVWQNSVIGVDYVVMHFLACNNKLAPIVKMVGQILYPDRDTARKHLASAFYEIEKNGTPSQELMPLFSMIIHVQSTGQIEIGLDDEVYVDCRKGFPMSRY